MEKTMEEKMIEYLIALSEEERVKFLEAMKDAFPKNHLCEDCGRKLSERGVCYYCYDEDSDW